VPDPLQTLLQKDRIVDAINTLFVATDEKDWETVKGCFADEVLFDVTSLGADVPETLTPDAIAAAWEDGLRPIEALHHQTGNHRVEVSGDEAIAFCYGTASHYRKTASGRNTRTFVGSYDLHLRRASGRWVIDQFTFNLKFLDGNPELEKD
jgi:ketosteroid isomerase-like protein